MSRQHEAYEHTKEERASSKMSSDSGSHLSSTKERGMKTILVNYLSLDADEAVVFRAMSKCAGKVRDVKIIRDPKNGRSRGVAYVEFWSQEGRAKALSFDMESTEGIKLKECLGKEVAFLDSHASKSIMDDTEVGSDSDNDESRNTSILPTLRATGTDGLIDAISIQDIRDLFSAFGPIQSIERVEKESSEARDSSVVVRYRNLENAQGAMKVLRGMTLMGKTLHLSLELQAVASPRHVEKKRRVDGFSSTRNQNSIYAPDLDISEDTSSCVESHKGLIQDNASRARLMRALCRQDAIVEKTPGFNDPPLTKSANEGSNQFSTGINKISSHPFISQVTEMNSSETPIDLGNNNNNNVGVPFTSGLNQQKSRLLQVRNLWSVGDQFLDDTSSVNEFFERIREDIQEEVKSITKSIDVSGSCDIWLDETSTFGDCLVLCKDTMGAAMVISTFNGKYFNNRKIAAFPLPENHWYNKKE